MLITRKSVPEADTSGVIIALCSDLNFFFLFFNPPELRILNLTFIGIWWIFLFWGFVGVLIKKMVLAYICSQLLHTKLLESACFTSVTQMLLHQQFPIPHPWFLPFSNWKAKCIWWLKPETYVKEVGVQTSFPYPVFFPFLKHFTRGSTALIAGARLCPAWAHWILLEWLCPAQGSPWSWPTAAAPADFIPPAPKPWQMHPQMQMGEMLCAG